MQIFNTSVNGTGFLIGRTTRASATAAPVWEFWKTREKAEKRLAKLQKEKRHVSY